MAVRNESLSRGNPVISVIVIGRARKDNRNARRWQVVPRPVIVSCPVPVSIIRTVPVPRVEKELEPGIGCEIGITTGYRIDGRRCSYCDCRKRRNPYTYPNIKIYITG